MKPIDFLTRPHRHCATLILHQGRRFFLAVLLLGASIATGFTACVPSPEGLVGWWQGEGSPSDFTGTNNGVLVGNASYASGLVNQGFVLDGNADGISLGTPPALQLQNLTIETWIRRSSAANVSGGGGNAVVLGCGLGGYMFWMEYNGVLHFNRYGDYTTPSGPAITDTNFHHVAVIKSGTALIFCLDGQAYPLQTYSGTFTFTSEVRIGCSTDGSSGFLGTIDELAVYNRGLSTNEIQAIYAAGSSGKCSTLVAPYFFSQPADRTAYVGTPVIFTAAAGGAPPLSYQWRLNGDNLAGATTSRLTLPAVQLTNAGNYSVVVSNNLGSVTSSNALLTVLAAPDCLPAPPGLAGWWQGEGDASEVLSGLSSTLAGNVAYAPGRVGQGFVLDGNGDGINLGNPASLQLEDLTFEMWIKRSSGTSVSTGSGGNAVLFGGGYGGYCYWMEYNGVLHFNRFGDYATPNGPTITDTNWHHVAVTKSGTALTFFLDGVASPVQIYAGTFTFTTTIGIGFNPNNLDNSFLGTIDEPSVYNRGLSASELQAIYAVGSSGKCFTPTPPRIFTQPASRTAFAGESTSFSVNAGGTWPLTYQWRLEGTNLIGATNITLILPLVRPEDAGVYSVVVSNSLGSETSSNALLTVLPAPPCSPAPAGLVGWWRAQGDDSDQVGGIPGSSIGSAAFGPGRVGQGFVLDGNGDGISLGNPAALQMQNLTIEGWIKRASATSVSGGSGGNAVLLGYGVGGYCFWMEYNGVLHFNRNGDYASPGGPTITDTNFHHVAVAKAGSSITFYLDGVAYPVSNYTTTFSFTTSLTIGCNSDGSSGFLGTIDELSVYNRNLSTTEIQTIYSSASGGKCVTPFPAFVVTPPASQTATVGSSATLTVVAGGTPPFTYQWMRHGTNLPGATASSLTIPNVQFVDAGSYGAIVSNILNSATSAVATLSVAFPPATVRVVPMSGMGGGPVTVPLEIVANGNETALQFSLSYNSSLLTYAGTALGTNFVDATLFVNTSQLGSGRLGVILSLPPETTMAAGAQQVVLVTFHSAVRSTPTSTTISFGDNPTLRQLVDAQAGTLSAAYSSGNVSLSASILEGDTSPRPNGDRAVTVSDWVLLGRYAARLDYPTNSSEFQRADCAPRSTFGDGAIKVTDWVQVGRYAGAADPLTVVGGPTTEMTGGGSGDSVAKDGSDRSLIVANNAWFIGQTGVVSVVLKGTGNESALGFSLTFDPTRFSFLGAAKGTGTGSATLNVNASEAASGRLGVTLGLSSGALPAGNNEVLKLTLRALPNASAGATTVSFAHLPVPCEISDGTALPLASLYESGSITVHLFPVLGIARSGGNFVLTWPGWASNFTLQAAGALGASGWTNAGITPAVNNGEFQVSLPASAPTFFYRLAQP